MCFTASKLTLFFRSDKYSSANHAFSILEGLFFADAVVPEIGIPEMQIYYLNHHPYIRNAEGGYYMVYRLDGQVVTQSSIESNEEMIEGLQQGLYIINVYGQGTCLQSKLIVR